MSQTNITIADVEQLTSDISYNSIKKQLRPTYVALMLKQRFFPNCPLDKSLGQQIVVLINAAMGATINPKTLKSHLSKWRKKDAELSDISYFTQRRPNGWQRYTSEHYDIIMSVLEEHFLVRNHKTVSACHREYDSRIKLHNFNAPEFEKINPLGKSRFSELVKLLSTHDILVSQRGISEAKRILGSKHASDCYHPFSVGEAVEMDAAHVTIYLREGAKTELKRVIIYLAIDVYSRAIVGWHVAVAKSENTTDAVQLLQHMGACKKHYGTDYPVSFVPRNLVTDRSTAFTNNSFVFGTSSATRICWVEPGQPYKKPFIERFIRTLRSQFLQALPGYIRKRTDPESVMHPRPKDPLTINDFEQKLAHYITVTYASSPHGGLSGCTPLQVYNTYLSETPFSLVSANQVSSAFKSRYQTERRMLHKGGVIALNTLKYSSDEAAAYYTMNVPIGKPSLEVQIATTPLDNQTIFFRNEATKQWCEMQCISLHSTGNKEADDTNQAKYSYQLNRRRKAETSTEDIDSKPAPFGTLSTPENPIQGDVYEHSGTSSGDEQDDFLDRIDFDDL